ncbi:MRC2-like protein [Mya arenaria]|uniref:MRC2-like protein n=1 Tax=Mya arenaria TaxID=6604 RepID=A0ABY7E2B3_MYAAR|nr:MRC2-like protein [Mya arenaria]
MSWNDARGVCQIHGGDLLRIDSAQELNYINNQLKYRQQHNHVPASNWWIGLNNAEYITSWTWADNTQVGSFITAKWARGAPNNANGSERCGEIVNGNQFNDEDCSDHNKFICYRDRVYANSGLCVPQTRGATTQTFVNSYLQEMKDSGVGSIWIGASAERNGFWHATTNCNTNKQFVCRIQMGRRLSSYTNWAPTQPNNLRLQQNCVGIENNQWNDFECRSLRQFVCSKVADSVYPSLPPTTPARDWTVKCGPGWESNPLSAYCYMFVDKPLSWLDAHSECTSLRGGHLVSIESASEQSYVAGKVQSLNSLAVWTGANDRATEGGWQWIGGAPFAFFNWADGQPDGAGGNGTDCVAMFTQTGLWDDLDCSARNGFVCEKLGNVPPTTAVATTTPRVPAGKVLGCDVGWLPFQSSCFRIFQGPRSWSNAQLACHYNGAELTSIRNRAEQNFLQGNLPKPKLSWDGFWIGLNDQQTDNRFLWTDGSTVTYTKWNINEPNNYMNRNEDCVEMRLASGRWNDEVCSMVRPGFICRKAKHAVSATQAPYSVGCPQAFITSMLNYQQGNFLIGLTDKKTPGTFYWAAGNPVGYTNWVSSHTGNEQNTCVAMQTSVPAGLWKTVDCNQGNRFICQFSRTGFTLPPTTPTLFPNTPCPTGYTADGPYCLHAITALNARRTWMSARSYCQALGGDLPSFHSNYNDSILTTMLAKYKGMSFWIGLNDRDTEAGYVWSDGTGVDYTNWNSNEPNDFKGQEDCVLYQTLSNKWNDNTCYLAQAYICALPRGTTLSRVTIPPKFQHSSLCGSDPSWLYYNNSCYMVSPRSGDNSSVNWYDAQAYCNAAQSNLASIHDLNENNFLTSIVGNTAKNEWIDGMPLGFINWNPGQPDNYMGAFWNDQHCDSPDQGFVCKKPAQGVAKVVVPSPFPPGGCPHAFVRVPGGRNKCFLIGGKQPTDRLNFTAAVNFCRHFGPGYDIVVHNHHDEWVAQQFLDWTFRPCTQQSQSCVVMRMYLPSLAIVTPASQCTRAGYVQYRKSCYRPSIPSDARTWSDAQSICQNEGGNLVCIQSVFESAFVHSLISQNYSYWIGLSDTKIKGLYGWADGWPVGYTNWGWKEPSYNQQGTGCVVANTNGKWNDTSCTRLMRYVCEISSEADRECSHAGGNIASIHSQSEMDFVFYLVQQAKVTNPQYQPNIWLGLEQGGQGGYTWTDGSAVNFVRWTPGEPTLLGAHGQVEECIEFDRTKGTWNDISCYTNRGYVCKSQRILSTKPPVATPSAGGLIVNQGNDSFVTYKAQTGPIALRTGQGYTQLPGITSSSNLGMSNGGIAGVVLGCIIAIALIAVALILLKRRGVIKAPPLGETGNLGFDNAMYSRSDDSVKLDSDA